MRTLIRQKIIDSLALPVPDLTRRDVRVPGVPGKAVAVIGMRGTGKTTFLWQVLRDRLRGGVDVGGFEVDFLARYPDGREELIKVCADLDDSAVMEREIRALLGAKEEYSRATQYLITLQSDPVRSLPSNITAHSAAAWLLGDDRGNDKRG